MINSLVSSILSRLISLRKDKGFNKYNLCSKSELLTLSNHIFLICLFTIHVLKLADFLKVRHGDLRVPLRKVTNMNTYSFVLLFSGDLCEKVTVPAMFHLDNQALRVL